VRSEAENSYARSLLTRHALEARQRQRGSGIGRRRQVGTRSSPVQVALFVFCYAAPYRRYAPVAVYSRREKVGVQTAMVARMRRRRYGVMRIVFRTARHPLNQTELVARTPAVEVAARYNRSGSMRTQCVKYVRFMFVDKLSGVCRAAWVVSRDSIMSHCSAWYPRCRHVEEWRGE